MSNVQVRLKIQKLICYCKIVVQIVVDYSLLNLQLFSFSANVHFFLIRTGSCPVTVKVIIIIIIIIQPFWAGLAGTRVQSGDRYGSGTLRSRQLLRGRFSLLSPASRRSHLCRQMPPRPHQRKGYQ
jgi:hypothetical protein